MSYFYVKTTETYNKICDYDNIIANNGSVVENNDGTVSVFTTNGPMALNKICCETLKVGYSFNITTQKCMWTNETPTIAANKTCSLDSFKLTLNPNGNSGSIFYIDDSSEKCSLNIEFDYLFKISCESLTKTLTQATKTSTTTINDEECQIIKSKITELKVKESNTSYSITCNTSRPTTPYNGTFTKAALTPFNNSAFGAPYQFDLEDYGTETLCLTDAGLNQWGRLLGKRYNDFLNGDPSSYNCTDFNNLKKINQEIIASNGDALYFKCTTPFGTKTLLLNEIKKLEEEYANCMENYTVKVNELNQIQSTIDLVSDKCGSPIGVLESLDVSLSLDYVDSNQNLVTVATFPILSEIGTGNLYNYLIENKESGFLVCGEPNNNEIANGITGCTPIYLESNSDNNVYSCTGLITNILDGLLVESNLDETTFNSSFNKNALASRWLRYQTTIDDETILNEIKNKNIKISIQVNSSCGDLCILLDNIEMNKDCSIVSENKMFISNSPGFKLDRVIDNKKSWVDNTTPVNRPFEIANVSGLTSIRQTNYDVNDERLVINTKEIDLDIDIASAIETDVWCYIKDNPCLLTATNTSRCMSSEYLEDACCGDESSVDYTSLMTQPLSDVTTIEELIDVKSRKILSGYPTLRALYDRYTNSTDYCPTTSSAFNYQQMDQFAHLIDSYWVDIVEQVVPATTIWGSVKIYGNTIFDQQKFEYKKGTLFTCLTGPCSLDNLEFLNACMNNVIDTFYTDECPSLATITSTYYFGNE